MPTKKQKRAEIKRVTKISGFHVGFHDFLAEVDFDTLKKRNDSWESRHRKQSRNDRKIEEFVRIATFVALRSPVFRIQIHVHAAHQAGATPEELYKLIDRVGNYTNTDAKMNGMEAWRLLFRPDLPTIFRVVELTSDSFKRK